MNISKEGVDINNRFFEVIDTLIELKIIRGLQTFTKQHNINRWNLNTIRNNPEHGMVKPEWIFYLHRDFYVSPEWLITGNGKMFYKTPVKMTQKMKTLQKSCK